MKEFYFGIPRSIVEEAMTEDEEAEAASEVVQFWTPCDFGVDDDSVEVYDRWYEMIARRMRTDPTSPWYDPSKVK